MTEKKTLDINVPVLARVEGEGALDLRIEGDAITELKLRIFEPPRYFEKFLEGRSPQDVIDTVARICGICPVAYQMSAVQALESVFQTSASLWTQRLRRVMYCGEWLQSHSLHIHMLAAPDFLGANSILEMAKDHDAAVRRGLRLQALGNDLIALMGARSVHPVGVCAGGFHHAPDQEAVAAIRERLEAAKEDAAAVVRWVASLPLPHDEQDFVSVSLRQEQGYPMNSGRIVSDAGLDIDIREFDDYFAEQHIPHSTALHCLLQGRPYLVGPLARLNLNLERLPPETRALLDETGIAFPSRNMFHSIIARAIEMHYVIDEAYENLQAYNRPEQSRLEATPQAGIGFGCTEAPRGILWHRYELDDRGHVVSARIVPPTSQNQARIEEDIARSLTHLGLDKSEDTLRLHAEKVIRNYDPCISCATHFLDIRVKRERNFDNALASQKPPVSSNTAGVKIIGIGSPFGSDSLGWQVIQRLQQDESITASPNIDLIALDRPGPQLLQHLQDTDKVIIVDAIAGNQERGSLVQLDGTTLTDYEFTFSSHQLGIGETLALGSALHQLPMQLIILGIETGGDPQWHYDEKLCIKLVTVITRLVKKWRASGDALS